MYKRHVTIFKQLSKILEKLGDEPRSTSYHKLYKKLELGNLEGISEKSKKKIDEITKTGKLKILTDLQKDKKVKAKLELIKIIGVGPSVAEKLVNRNITTFSQFKRDREKKTKLQELGVKYHNKIGEPSFDIFHYMTKFLCNYVPGVKDIAIAGSYRTGNENPNDIDLILVTKDGRIEQTIKVLEKCGILVDYLKSGPEDLLGVILYKKKFYRIDIKVTTKKYFATYLLFFGSGKYFSKYIRGVAKEKGYKLNQYGITKDGKLKTFRSERAVFKFLGLKYLTPQERVLYF
jgi:DNA polymerase (family 10)